MARPVAITSPMLKRDKAVRHSTLVQIRKNLSNSFDIIQKTILEINDTTGNIKILDQQYQNMLKQAGTCPLCRQKICEGVHEN